MQTLGDFSRGVLGVLAVLSLQACSGSNIAGSSAVIVNSGSTNNPGFDIVVASTGYASWHNSPSRYGHPNLLECTSAAGATFLDGGLSGRLFVDLAAARSLASLPFLTCPKSVSFGTFTTITYGGATAGDTECGSSDPRGQALSQDVADVEKAIRAACQ